MTEDGVFTFHSMCLAQAYPIMSNLEYSIRQIIIVA